MDFPSWCRVWAKVVCVNADETIRGCILPISKGEIYQIEQIIPPRRTYTFSGFEVTTGLVFREVRNPFSPYDDFNINRFRPLTSTKTEAEDLAYFKQFLQSSIETSHWKQDERAD